MKKYKIIIVVVAIILLAGIFMLMRPGQKTNDTAVSTVQTPNARNFELIVTDGKLSSGESTLKVRQNDTVNIKVSSNTIDELHLHGYDKSIEMEPGKIAEYSFKADRSGRFEAELHSNEALVFVLEVQPE